MITVGCGYEPPAGAHGETLLAHDSHRPLMVHHKPIPAKLSSDPPVAVVGVLGADFPYFLDDFCLPDWLSSRLVIVRRASKIHELASSSDGEARGLIPAGPNELWVADLTFIAIARGFVYLAVILDAWSKLARCDLGWSAIKKASN